MKAKLRGTTGAPFDVEEIPVPEDGIPFARYFADNEGNIFSDGVLEFVSDTPAPNAKEIEGWVTVDEFSCGVAYLHTQYPRCVDKSIADTGDYEAVWESDGIAYELDQKLFPELTEESEPLKVRLSITRIEE